LNSNATYIIIADSKIKQTLYKNKKGKLESFKIYNHKLNFYSNQTTIN